MRKNWRERSSADRRGKITTGSKTISKSGKEIPKSLDYFNISKFEELIEVYGDKPQRLIIVFLSDDKDSFFLTEYNKYGSSDKGSWKIRSCDGEEVIHHVPEVINGVKHPRGEVHECFNCGTDACTIPDDDQCRCYTGFNAYIVNPFTGRMIYNHAYRFQTNSINSGDNILTGLKRSEDAFGGIAYMPFILSVQRAEVQTDKGKSVFPIWELHNYGTIDQINTYRENMRLPTSEQNAFLIEEKAVVDESKLLEAPEPEIEEDDSVLGVDVNDPYPEDVPLEKKGEDDRDILERKGILSEIELDMDDSSQVVAQLVKMLMEINGENRSKARNKLKELSTNQNTGHPGYNSTKDLLDSADNTFIRAVFAKGKKLYRDHLLKIEAKETQQSLV